LLPAWASALKGTNRQENAPSFFIRLGKLLKSQEMRRRAHIMQSGANPIDSVKNASFFARAGGETIGDRCSMQESCLAVTAFA
jgi:hypothetical protein